jgi:hypothetical protein
MDFGQPLLARKAGTGGIDPVRDVIAQQQIDPARLATFRKTCSALRVQTIPQNHRPNGPDSRSTVSTVF